MEGVSIRGMYSIMMEATQGIGKELSKEVASGDSSLSLTWLEALEHELYHRVCLPSASRLGFCTPVPVGPWL